MYANTHNRRFGRIIRDGARNLCVTVKPEDITGAICRDHQRCAVARAIKRRYKAEWVDVGAHTVLIATRKGEARKYRLSPTAKKQVQYFDTHKGAFAPCTVKLYKPYLFKQRKVLTYSPVKRRAKRSKPTR